MIWESKRVGGGWLSGKSGWVDTVIGITLTGGVITGITGLVFALISVLEGDWAAAGTCLIAAALAFGLLVYSLLGGLPTPRE